MRKVPTCEGPTELVRIILLLGGTVPPSDHSEQATIYRIFRRKDYREANERKSTLTLETAQPAGTRSYRPFNSVIQMLPVISAM